MVEKFTATPFDPKHDERLSVAAYAKEIAWEHSGALIAVAAVAFGRLTNYKVFPLDGSASIITRFYEKLYGIKALNLTKLDVKNFNKAAFGARIEGVSPTTLIGEVLETGTHAQQQAIRHPWLSSLPLANDLNNFLKAAEVGAVFYLYRKWAHKEQKRFDLVEGYDKLSKLPHLKPTDDELREENSALKAQLEFMDKPTTHAALAAMPPYSKVSGSELEHAGTISEAHQRHK